MPETMTQSQLDGLAAKVKPAKAPGTMTLSELSRISAEMRPPGFVPGPKDEPSFFTEMGARLRIGTLGVLGSFGGTLPQMVGETLDVEAITRYGKFEKAWYDAEAAEWGKLTAKYPRVVEKPELLWNPRYLAMMTAQTFPSFAASIAPGMAASRIAGIASVAKKIMSFSGGLIKTAQAARGIAAGVAGGATAGSLEGLALYDELRRKGESPDDAAAKAALMALGSGLLNAYQIKGMLTPGVRRRIVHMIKSGAVEGVTEWLEEPLAGIISEDSKKEIIQRMKDGLDVIAPSMILGAFGGAGVTRTEPLDVRDDVAKAQDAEDIIREAEEVLPKKVELGLEAPEITEPIVEVGEALEEKSDEEVADAISKEPPAEKERSWDEVLQELRELEIATITETNPKERKRLEVDLQRRLKEISDMEGGLKILGKRTRLDEISEEITRLEEERPEGFREKIDKLERESLRLEPAEEVTDIESLELELERRKVEIGREPPGTEEHATLAKEIVDLRIALGKAAKARGKKLGEPVRPRAEAKFSMGAEEVITAIADGLGIDKSRIRLVDKVLDPTGKEMYGVTGRKYIDIARILNDVEIDDQQKIITIGHEGFELYLNMVGYDNPLVRAGLTLEANDNPRNEGETEAEYNKRMKEYLADDVGKVISEMSRMRGPKSAKHKRIASWLKRFWIGMKARLNMGRVEEAAELLAEDVLGEKPLPKDEAAVAEPEVMEVTDTEMDQFLDQQYGPIEEGEKGLEFRDPRHAKFQSDIGKDGFKISTLIQDDETIDLGDSNFYKGLQGKVGQIEIDLVKHISTQLEDKTIKGADLKQRMLNYLSPERAKPVDVFRSPEAARKINLVRREGKQHVRDKWPGLHRLWSPEFQAYHNRIATRPRNEAERRVARKVQYLTTGFSEAEQKTAYIVEEERQLFKDSQKTLTESQQLKVRPAMEAIYNKDAEALAQYTPEVQRAALAMAEYFNSMRALYRNYLTTMIGKHLSKDMYAAYQDMMYNQRTAEEVVDDYGVDPIEIEELIEKHNRVANWGIDDYITNIERGFYRIVDGNEQTRAVAVTMTDAKRKAKALSDAHPDIQLHLQTTFNAASAFKSVVTQGTFWSMVDKINKAITEENESLTVSAKGISKAIGRSVLVKPTKVFAGPTIKRKGVLAGEENIFNAIYGYSHAMHRKIHLDPLLDDAKRILPTLPTEWRQMIEDQIKYVKGTYSMGDRLWDTFLRASLPMEGDPEKIKWVKDILTPLTSRMKPMGVTRFVQKARYAEGVLKLGYRPVATAVNWAGGHSHTMIKVGSEYFIKGWHFRNTDEFKEFMKRNPGVLGISLEHELMGAVTKLKAKRWWTPMGMFAAPEPQIRTVGLAANYLYLRDVIGIKDQATLDRETGRAMRMQNFTYNVAALPHILRSPAGKLIGQYKSYMVFELQFISTLRGKEIARYALMQALLGGPRGLVALAKSVPPIMILFGLLDIEPDETMNWLNEKLAPSKDALEKWDLSRGLIGLFGGDISLPATFQLPKDFDDLAGPFLSDLIKMFTVLRQKVEGLDSRFVKEDFKEWAMGLSPAMHYWGQLWDSVHDRDGIVRDRRGNELYRPVTIDKLLFLPTGVAPTSYKEMRIKERVQRRELKKYQTNRTRAIGTIAKWLVEDQDKIVAYEASSDLPDRIQDLFSQFNLDKSSIASIEDRLKKMKITPEQRSILMAPLVKRPELIELWQRGYISR